MLFDSECPSKMCKTIKNLSFKSDVLTFIHLFIYVFVNTCSTTFLNPELYYVTDTYNVYSQLYNLH